MFDKGLEEYEPLGTPFRPTPGVQCRVLSNNDYLRAPKC